MKNRQERLIEEVRRAFTALGRHYPRALTEAATGDWLVEPILRSLDYYWVSQSHHGQNILDYELGDEVAVEIKRNSAKYGHIDALNDHARFRTVAEQVVTYLDECKLKTMLYSNGFFWWRIEREEGNQRLHALRFDMRLAYNETENRGTTQHLSRFTPVFHRKAFLPGNNYSIGIHQGLGQKIEPAEKIGLVWMKDLNNGYRNGGL